MTVTEATHALAALTEEERPARTSAALGVPMRLVDALSRVEPTWVEAVAVVQAVCAQLPPGQAVPPLECLMLAPSGAVSFPPGDASSDVAAVRAAGQLLSTILRSGDCPMPVWEATERARRAPDKVGTAASFGLSLDCFPVAQGPRELERYFQAARCLAPPTARPATASFSFAGLSARAGTAIVAAALAGVGAGISVGVLVAQRTVLAAAPAHTMAAITVPGAGGR